MIKYGNKEITKKFSRLKTVSSIYDDYLETATGGGPSRKLRNRGNHGYHGNSSCTKELQILPIKIKKENHKSEFDKF